MNSHLTADRLHTNNRCSADARDVHIDASFLALADRKTGGIGHSEFQRNARSCISRNLTHAGEPMFFSDDAFRAPRTGLVAFMLLIGMAPTLLTAGEASAQGMQKDMPGMGSAKKSTTATGSGTVTSVNVPNRKVTLDHGPMPAINWPAMKMEFAVAPSIDLSKLKTGDKVNFTLSGSGNSYTVQSIGPAQ